MTFSFPCKWTCFRWKATMSLVLTGQQETVKKFLKKMQTEKHPLSDWYLGALHALNHPNNPDCVAQTAHSLREVIEKFLRMTNGKDTNSPRGFEKERKKLSKLFSRAKKHYKEGWEGKDINEPLDTTLKDLCHYLRLYRQPTPGAADRAETQVDQGDDYSAGRFQQRKRRKRDELRKLKGEFVEISHHGGSNIGEVKKLLETLEGILFNLAVTTQDQDDT